MTRVSIFFLVTVLFFASCSRMMHGGEGRSAKNEKTRTAEGYFCEGMKFYTLDNLAEAETWFRKSYEINPENAGLNFILGKLYVKKKDLNQGLFYTEKAVRLNEKNTFYQRQLADIYIAQSNVPEAVKVYKKLIALHPGDEDNYFELAALYQYQKNLEEAVNVYNQAEQKFGKSPEVSKQKQDLYLRMNKEDAALQESRSLMEAFPGDNNIRLGHAEMLISRGKKEEARTVLNEVIATDPDDPYSRFLLAKLYLAEKNYDRYFTEISKVYANPEMELDTKLGSLNEVKAAVNESGNKKVFQEIVSVLPQTHPDRPLAYLAYGDVLYSEGEKKQAWNQYLKAVNIDDTNFELWNQLLMLESELNQTDSMIVHSQRALEIFPNQAAFWYYNGSAYMLAKKHEEAIEALEQGKRLALASPQLLVQFNALLGDNYNEIQDYVKSDLSYEEALKIDSDNVHVLNNYTYFLSLRNEKLPLAMEMGERLMKIAPDNPAYLDTYGWVLYKMGKYDDARRYIEKAQKNSTDGTIAEHYGDILFQLGEKDKALDEWKKARKLGQTSEKIDKKIQDKKLYE
jgi:tetratricopeptide (TPR) repeat protein